MTIRRCAGFIALVLCFSPLSVEAGYIAIQSDPNLNYEAANCISGGAQVDVYVMYIPTPNDDVARRVQFKVPLPGCVSITGRRDHPVLPGVGDSMTDVVVDFQGCPSEPIHILTIRLFNLNVDAECCEWRAADVDNSLDISGWDCGGNAIEIDTRPAWLSNRTCGVVAPNTPMPADSATIDSLSTHLEWLSSSGPVCEPGDAITHTIYFGADPGALAAFPNANTPFPAVGLLPSTTYYWRVEAATLGGAGPYPGPLWRFTTPNTLATEQTTWGAVKARYR